MLTENWTIDQKKKLLDEYVLFRIEEMTRDEMASYVYDSMRQEIIVSRPDLTLDETLKQEIDEYDEYLYEKHDANAADSSVSKFDEISSGQLDRI